MVYVLFLYVHCIFLFHRIFLIKFFYFLELLLVSTVHFCIFYKEKFTQKTVIPP